MIANEDELCVAVGTLNDIKGVEELFSQILPIVWNKLEDIRDPELKARLGEVADYLNQQSCIIGASMNERSNDINRDIFMYQESR